MRFRGSGQNYEQTLEKSPGKLPKWIGKWRTPARKGHKREFHRRLLGYVSDVTREEALAALHAEIEHRDMQIEIMENLRSIPSAPIITASKRAAGMNKGDYGAIAEMIVAADLISKGFPVFRALSFQCECDLIYIDGPRFVRVEVKAGTIRPSGGVQVRGLERNAGKFDVLAVALPNGEIRYRGHHEITNANYPVEPFENSVEPSASDSSFPEESVESTEGIAI